MCASNSKASLPEFILFTENFEGYIAYRIFDFSEPIGKTAERSIGLPSNLSQKLSLVPLAASSLAPARSAWPCDE